MCLNPAVLRPMTVLAVAAYCPSLRPTGLATYMTDEPNLVSRSVEIEAMSHAFCLCPWARPRDIDIVNHILLPLKTVQLRAVGKILTKMNNLISLLGTRLIGLTFYSRPTEEHSSSTNCQRIDPKHPSSEIKDLKHCNASK